MPGVLTSMMVLIEADRWLGELEADLAPGGRRPAKSALEQRMHDLAAQARQFLRFQYDPTTPAAKLPPPSPARITNRVGDGISQFAYAGVIAPIFPAASDILALNQSWVSDLIHRGSFRTAYKNAHSTSLVLDALTQENLGKVVNEVNQDEKSGRFYPPSDSPNQLVVAALKRPMMSFLLGQLAGIAAHVVLRPFVNARVWGANGVERRPFEVQLDAQVARGYFGRHDLFTGQSWTAYLLDDDVGLALIAELYYQAFVRAFPDVPSQTEDPPRSRYEIPITDRGFLIDGYKNVRNWALAAGYHHDPWSYRVVFALLFTGAAGIALLLSKKHFDPPAAGAAASPSFQAWQDHGFFGNEGLWFEVLDQSYSMPGYLLGIGLGWLLNSPIPGTTFLFGRGTVGFLGRPGTVVLFKLLKYTYKGLKLKYTFSDPDTMAKPQIRWPRLTLDVGFDLLDYKHFSKPNPAEGVEGDILAVDLWLVGLPVVGLIFVALSATFAVKSAMGSGPQSETGISGRDVIIACLTVFVGFLIIAGLGWFDDWLLERLIGTPWPRAISPLVAPYVPLDLSTGKFQETNPPTFPVKVFQASDLKKVKGQDAYPQDDDPAIAWVDRPARDEAMRRKTARDSTRGNYTFVQLYKRAAYLAGTLMMAAVSYDTGSAEDRRAARAIFQDWNLDYRTQEEWDDLIETNPSGQVGLARAAEQWWVQGSSDRAVLEPLEQALNVGWQPFGATHYGRIEDRSIAPWSAREDMARRYLGNTPFTIVDRAGNTVFSGTTDPDGHYSATLPAGGDYELRIVGYAGLGP